MRTTSFGSLCLTFAILCFPAVCSAHGVASTPAERPAYALLFHYSDGTPMSYAEAMAYAPGRAEVEHANGRTDARGVFAFVPAEPGDWRVVVSDGMGHKAEAVVHVAASTSSEESTAAPLVAAKAPNPSHAAVGATPTGVLLGLSALANLFMGVALIRRRHR